MIEIIAKSNRDNIDLLLKKYKQKLDKTRFNRKVVGRKFFQKPSEKRKKEIQRAVLRQRYLQRNGLV